MNKVIIFLLVLICFCNCSEFKKERVDFVRLNESEFDAKPFDIPNGKIPDSLKRSHDSCMGFSFDANIMLAQRKDSLFIGTIVNRKSLKVLNTLSDLGLTAAQQTSGFNIITNPCYEQRVISLPLKSLLGENFSLQLPNGSEALNKEINDAIKASDDAEMHTGSWVYLDMKDVLKNMLDTIKSSEGLLYKKNLLDSSNMVLTAIESVTNVSFIIHTKKELSVELQAILRNKVSLPLPDPHISIRLFYIDSDKFEITFNGFFPVVGEFMKAELQ